ncbi:MAG TPA: type IX secretion system plug protein domain-containing protein [Balneolaceae bacterium]|nr:type IX secretion system plug protein domain-containing protein [Balneolaceae bacterium]
MKNNDQPSGRNGTTGYFNTPVQMVNSRDVHSIQLERKGVPGSLPAIELSSDEQLELSFDLIGFESRTLFAEFVHHTKDWTPSLLSTDFYIDGLQRIYLPFGRVSAAFRPSYRSYSYSFPDEQFRFTRSGNYLLRITDQESGMLLFSLPFYVYENEGSLTGSTERIRSGIRDLHRPVGKYHLPDFITQPSFDLHFHFIQNRFIGKGVNQPLTDFSDEHLVYVETPPRGVFIGDYEFMKLNLTPLSISNHQIRSFDPVSAPMQAILTVDTESFNRTGDKASPGSYGSPLRNPDTPYVDVTFTLEADIEEESDEIYLVGDFTNWSIRNENRLYLSEETGLWQTRAVIKEGQYDYKYILVRDQQPDDLYFDALFTPSVQEYLMLVYMRDHREFYDRLMQYGQFLSN